MHSSNKNEREEYKIIDQHISKARLASAINQLLGLLQRNDEIYNDLLLMSMKLHIVNQAVARGRISWSKEVKTKSQIANQLLYFIQELKEQSTNFQDTS